MEKFLKDYVKMYIKVSGDELTREQIQELVNNLMNEEEIWDTLDNYINEYLEEI